VIMYASISTIVCMWLWWQMVCYFLRATWITVCIWLRSRAWHSGPVCYEDLVASCWRLQLRLS
jgi:hypothetical protein